MARFAPDTVIPADLFKYLNIEATRKVLTQRQVLMRCPKHYADPDDMQWDLMYPLRDSTTVAPRAEVISRLIRDPVPLSPSSPPEYRAIIIEHRLRARWLPVGQRERYIRHQAGIIASSTVSLKPSAEIQSICHRFRLFCTTTDPRSLFMWTNYAEQGTGFVLGFSTPDLQHALNARVCEVVYVDRFPDLVSSEALEFELACGDPSTLPRPEVLERYMYTKLRKWSMEREWRFIHRVPAEAGTADRFHPFGNSQLLSIFAGPHTDESTRSEMLRLARDINPRVACWQMQTDGDGKLLIGTRL